MLDSLDIIALSLPCQKSKAAACYKLLRYLNAVLCSQSHWHQHAGPRLRGVQSRCGPVRYAQAAAAAANGGSLAISDRGRSHGGHRDRRQPTPQCLQVDEPCRQPEWLLDSDGIYPDSLNPARTPAAAPLTVTNVPAQALVDASSLLVLNRLAHQLPAQNMLSSIASSLQLQKVQITMLNEKKGCTSFQHAANAGMKTWGFCTWEGMMMGL